MDANLRGFEVGLEVALAASAGTREGSRGFGTPLAPDPSRAPADGPAVDATSPDIERMAAGFPEAFGRCCV